jgi:DnaJ domain/PilZ domain
MWLFGLGTTRRSQHPRKAHRFTAEWLRTPLGQVKDLSTSGLRISGQGRPTVTRGKVAPVKLLTPQGELNFVGRVAWVKRVKGGFEAGLELLDVKPHLAARLRELGELGFIPGSGPAHGSDGGDRARSSSVPNPYAVLEIEATASDEQVQKAYRRLARIYHPDANKSPDAAAKFKQVVDAYHRLQKTRIGFAGSE